MSDWRYWTLLFINMPIQVLKLLMEVALIKGIYGDESHLFSPEQWVNVYELSEGYRAIYYASMQVKDLGDLKNEDYGLEPVTEHGELMTIAEAKQCCQ